MSRKINPRTLIIILVVLLLIVVITQVADKKQGERTFSGQLFELDTAKITSLILHPKVENFREIKFERAGNRWIMRSENKEYKVEGITMENLLGQLLNMEVKRLAGNNSAHWEKFELSDSLASWVTIMEGENKIGDLYVGKYGYNYQMREGFSYVRTGENDKVWAVNGFLQPVYDVGVNKLRFNKLINSNKSDWNKIIFEYPADSSFVLSKEESGWLIDGAKPDSAGIESYLNGLVRLSSNEFVDDEGVTVNPDHIFKVRIEGNNFMPIELKAYPAPEEHVFLIKSSINEGTRFSGAKGGLGTKIFVGKNQFLPKEETE